jgi:serine/threonine-protein kinase RsbW
MTGAAIVRERLTVEAQPAALDALHDALARFWSAADREAAHPPDPDWRMRFETGLAEVLGNVIKHAYPTPSNGRLRLDLRLYPDRAEARLLDRGVPFAEPRRADEALPEGGLGLGLARATVDALTYERTSHGANRWLLVKRMGATTGP